MDLPNLWFYYLFLIPLVYLYLHQIKLRKYAGVPPGTSGLPLIGETLSFALKLRKGAPVEFVRDRVQKYSSNIFRTSIIGEQVVFIAGAEGNRFLFSNEDKLVQAWVPSRIEKLFPLSRDSPSRIWQRKCLRKTVSPWILNTEGLRGCVDILDTVTKHHVEAFWTQESGDEVIISVAENAKWHTLAFLCKAFLGIDDLSKTDELVVGIKAIEAAFVSPVINLPWTTWSKGMKASKALRSRIEAVVRAKKMKQNSSSPPEKDFIADLLLIKYVNGESIPEQDVACHLLSLLEAGYLSVHTTITMLFKTLAEYPDVYNSVLQEQNEIASSKKPGDGIKWEDFNKMTYSWNVVREILRVYSQTPASFRDVIADFTYEGYTIPKGWKVLWVPESVHMDPKYFPDPEKFDPSRFEGEGPSPYTFLPFATGLSGCPGYKLAKFQILTYLHYAVTNYRWEKVNPNEELLRRAVPYMAEGLPVRLHRHKI